MRPSLGTRETAKLISNCGLVPYRNLRGSAGEQPLPTSAALQEKTVRRWVLVHSVKGNERLSTKETGRLEVKSSCAEV